MSCYLVQEVDGVGRFTLEDGSGFLLLEDCVPSGGGDLPIGGVPVRRSRRRRKESIFNTEEEELSIILDSL